MKKRRKTSPKTDPKIGKIIPLGARVLVEPLPQEEKGLQRTDTGIYIPSGGETENKEQGLVVAVGRGEYDDGVLVPMEVGVGERVIFSKYGYDEIKMDGVKYYIIKQENILAVIK